MSTEDNLALLKSLDRRDARLRRRAGLVAWISVAAGAVVMAVLVFVAYQQLAQVRKAVEEKKGELEDLTKKKKDLEAELDKLRPLVENYRSIARQTPVAEANQMPEPLPATALQPRVYLQIVDQADRDHAKSMGAVALSSRYESAGEGVSNPASFP